MNRLINAKDISDHELYLQDIVLYVLKRLQLEIDGGVNPYILGVNSSALIKTILSSLAINLFKEFALPNSPEHAAEMISNLMQEVEKTVVFAITEIYKD